MPPTGPARPPLAPASAAPLGAAEAPGPAPHYHGHRERLRRRFLDGGPDALPDYELLELILCLAIPQKDVKPLAKDLLERFGGFAQVCTAPVAALTAVPGIKDNAAAAIKLAAAAAQRLARQDLLDRPLLASWDKVLEYCRIRLGHQAHEEFHLLFLDRKNALIADECQQKGTVDHTPVYPREVVKRALELNASALIMVHNHPSGDPTPSRADIDMTRRVEEAAKAVGIVLHDHLVITRAGHQSFRSLGLI